jgi:small-conductance mechanosensitive channel
MCLDEPRPTMFFRGFAESAQEVQLSVWVLRENFVALKNTLPEEIKRAFDEADIENPFPHRTLHVGPASAPIPVRIVGATSGEANGATPPVD